MKIFKASKKLVRLSLLGGVVAIGLGGSVFASAKTPMPSFRALSGALKMTDNWQNTCNQAQQAVGRYRCWVNIQGRDAQTGKTVTERFALCAARENSLIVLRGRERVEVFENNGDSSQLKQKNVLLADSARLDYRYPLSLKPVDWDVSSSSPRELATALSGALVNTEESDEATANNIWSTSDVTVSGRVLGKLSQPAQSSVAPVRAEGKYLVFENASLLDLRSTNAHIERGQLQLLLPKDVPHPSLENEQDYSMLP